jgi:hypothetical protein
MDSSLRRGEQTSGANADDIVMGWSIDGAEVC